MQILISVHILAQALKFASARTSLDKVTNKKSGFSLIPSYEALEEKKKVYANQHSI